MFIVTVIGIAVKVSKIKETMGSFMIDRKEEIVGTIYK